MIAGNPAIKILTYDNEADLFRKLAGELEERRIARAAAPSH
jgi:hypothetical protein